MVNLYGPAMTAHECIAAYQSLSRMIATSPNARFQQKLPLFRKGHSLLHGCFLRSLVGDTSDPQAHMNILDGARLGLQTSGISLHNIGVVLVSIAATMDRPSQSMLATDQDKASSATLLALVLSQHSLATLQLDHDITSEDLMHWFMHPISKIFSNTIDLSSAASPWKQIIDKSIAIKSSSPSIRLLKSVLEVYDRCKQLPPMSILASVYESSRQAVATCEEDGLSLASELSSLLWFVSRIQEGSAQGSSPMAVDREWIDLVLGHLSPNLSQMKGLPAKITPLFSLLRHQPSKVASQESSSFIQSYYSSMMLLLPSIASRDDRKDLMSQRYYDQSRVLGSKESEAKACLYDLSEAVQALPYLSDLPSHLRPSQEYIDLLLVATLNSLRHFLRLLSMRSRPSQQSGLRPFVPASILQVVTTSQKLKEYGYLTRRAWLKDFCELSRPALSRVESLETLFQLSEAVKPEFLSIGWYNDFCTAVQRLLTNQKLFEKGHLQAIRSFLEKKVDPALSRKCLDMIANRLPSVIVSAPAPLLQQELQNLIRELSTSRGHDTPLIVDRMLQLLLTERSDNGPDGSLSARDATHAIGIAIKALSEFKRDQESALLDPSLARRLLSLATYLCPYMSCGQLAQSALFSSRLDYSDTMLPWIESVSHSVATKLSSQGSSLFTVRDVSMILQGSSQLKHRHDPLWMDSLLDSISSRLQSSQPLELVMLLSNLACQKYLPGQPWVDVILQSIKSYLDDNCYQSRELSSIGASIQALGIRPDALWARSFIGASEVALKVPGKQVTAHKTIDHLSALAFLQNESSGDKAQNAVTLKTSAQMVASLLISSSLIHQLTAGDLIRCLDSIWKLHLTPSPDTLNAILSRSVGMMRSDIMPNHLAMSLWQLLAHSRFLPYDEWMETFASWSDLRYVSAMEKAGNEKSSVLTADVEMFTPLHVVKILLSIARLGIDINALGSEWSKGCQLSLSQYLPLLNPSLKSQVAWSIAKTGIDRGGRLMRQLEKVTALTVEAEASNADKRIQLSPVQAANLLWSMQKSGHSPPHEYIEGLLSLFTPLLSHNEPQPRNHDDHSIKDDPILTPRLLSLLTSSLAALRYSPRNPTFTIALMDRCRRLRHAMGPQSLALTFRSLVTINGHRASEEWLVDIIHSCVKVADELNEDEAGMICMAITECCQPKRPITSPTASRMDPEATVQQFQRPGMATLVRPTRPRQQQQLQPSNRELQNALAALSSAFSLKFTKSIKGTELCLVLNDISAIV